MSQPVDLAFASVQKARERQLFNLIAEQKGLIKGFWEVVRGAFVRLRQASSWTNTIISSPSFNTSHPLCQQLAHGRIQGKALVAESE